MLIHNAPWVFSGLCANLPGSKQVSWVAFPVPVPRLILIIGIWRLIRGWMDPDIAAKVHFTNSAADLEKFIAQDQIVEEVGGNEKWTYEYVEPAPNENEKMNDTTTRDALRLERQTIGDEFLTATSAWIDASKSKDPLKLQSSESERAYLAERLRVNHWRLDPYTRARTYLDRTRVIQEGGKIDFYPKDTAVQGEGEKIKTMDVEHLERISGMETQTVS